jgi:uncharacterized membrane protein YfcA
LPVRKVRIAAHVYLYSIVLLLVRGGNTTPSIIGLEHCNIGSWVCAGLHLVLSYLYSKSIAIKQFQRDTEKESMGFVFEDSRDKMDY